ncbi:MAG: HAMP domain-containing histidine kinase [Defluviitaleaceae bacterium]|nr:HAMP domain-containing histidine kinase [Defluviitaleaceae bacterium]
MTVPLTGTDPEVLSTLAAALAHEIKNPAAVALAHIAQLRKRFDLRGVGDTCDHIEEALEHICHLVQEMLLVTYGTAPAYEFDLEDMLLDMLEAYQSAWPQIVFSLDRSDNDLGLMYYGEETFVKMIFSNLMKNAVEAVGSAGTITIRLEKSKDYALVSVRDSGASGSSLKPHPSGLGLPICRWLLARIGGYLEFNELPIPGCEARVSLPIL